MKFNLTTTGSLYSDREKLALEKLGFKFTYDNTWPATPYEKIAPKVLSLEINSLEELIEFSKEWGEVIVTEDTIEIFDDYR